MWRVLPNQTGGLQGLHHVSGDGLAVEKLGIGSGWQQSKQNWLPPAVMGYWTWMLRPVATLAQDLTLDCWELLAAWGGAWA